MKAKNLLLSLVVFRVSPFFLITMVGGIAIAQAVAASETLYYVFVFVGTIFWSAIIMREYNKQKRFADEENKT